MADLKEIPIPKDVQQILVVATPATSFLALVLHIIVVAVHDLGSGDSRNRWGAVSGLGLTATIFVFVVSMVPILANYVKFIGFNERFMQIWRLLLLVGLMLAAAALGALGLLQVSMGASGVLAFIVDFALCLLLVALIYSGIEEVVAIERPRPAAGTVSEAEFDSRFSPLRDYEFVVFITGLVLGFIGLAGFFLSLAMKLAHASQQVESNVLLEIFITSMFGALLCVWCGAFEIPNHTQKGRVLSVFWTKCRRPFALMAMLIIAFSLGGFVNARYPLQNNHWDDAEDVSVVVILFQFLLLLVLSIYVVLCRRKNELESSYEQIP